MGVKLAICVQELAIAPLSAQKWIWEEDFLLWKEEVPVLFG